MWIKTDYEKGKDRKGMKRKMKVTGWMFSICILFSPGVAINLNAIQEKTPTAIQQNVAEEMMVSLYVSDDPQIASSIPQDYRQQYQLPAGEWKITEGESVTIDHNNLVQPAVEIWYVNGNISYSSPTGQPGETVSEEHVTGTTYVEGTAADGQHLRYQFTVYDYGLNVKAEQKLESLKQELIHDGMSELQILDAACQMAARQKYDVHYSDWRSMLLYQGGDCWASCDLILKICKDYGIEAKMRVANRDPGAGSGHRNVIAWIDGKVYHADAGYADDNLPRMYSLVEASEYSTRSENGKAYIYQYDGMDPVMNIPSAINGLSVVGLDEGSVSSAVEKVILPESIQTIDSRAFIYAENLKSIELKGDNKNFSIHDGDLYNKDFSVFLQHPAAATKDKVVIHSGVSTIGSYAFYQFNNTVHAKSIVVPKTVKKVEDCSFARFQGDTVRFQGEMPAFGKNVFAGCTLVVEHELDWNQTELIDIEQANSVVFKKVEDNEQKEPLEPQQSRMSMYRLYNPNSGEHFYTARAAERDHLVSVGWKAEGVGWIAPSESTTPVYRVYNPNAGDHHYTTSAGERDYLISAGWKAEGIGWYSDDVQSVPIYRQYNPNAAAGAHNYTSNKAENDMLVNNGWKAEGIGWYGLREE